MWPYATLSFTPWSCPGWSAWKWQQGLLQQNGWILVHTGYVSSLSFYSSNVIHHYCDTPPIFKLSCSNTGLHESILSTFADVNIVGTLLLILTSSSYILFSTFCMHTGEGRHKVSPDSHHPVVFHLHLYLSDTFLQLKVASVFYTVVIPMLNLLIYSLWNSEVRRLYGM